MTHSEFCYWLLGHIQSVEGKAYASLDLELVSKRLVKVLGEDEPSAVALTPVPEMGDGLDLTPVSATPNEVIEDGEGLF